MSETNMNVENSGSGIEAKITGIFDKMNSCIDKTLGFIVDHPWANWLKVGEKYVLRYLPLAVAFLGALTVLSTIIVACRADLGFGTVLKGLLGLVVLVAFVLYLLPKTTTLVTSLLDNREDEAIRPQVLGVMKTVGLVFAASLLFSGCDFVQVLVVLVVSLVLVVLAANPKINSYRWEQINWLGNKLLEDDPQHAMVMMHIIWNSVSASEPLPFTDNLTKLLEAFNHHESITLNSLTYDFTQTTGHVDYVLGGHLHTDHHDWINNILCIATTTFALNQTTPTFDMIVNDYDNNKAYFTRVGIGNSREFDI